MKIAPISFRNFNSKRKIDKTTPVENKQKIEAKRIEGNVFHSLNVVDPNGLFEIENISNPKIGAKFLLRPTDEKYSDLTILFKPETVLKSKKEDLDIYMSDNGLAFSGNVFGSIRKDESGTDYKMLGAYTDFWTKNMISKVKPERASKNIKNDYNFFIPSDGDGTRYRDITLLQGGVTKPASKIPAKLGGQNLSLVQNILVNFARTSKLDGFDSIKVKPAQGSAYAFLEGLASGKVPTDKPLVFSWGDNFSDISVSKIITQHEENKSGMTVLALPVDTERVKALSAIKVKSEDDLQILDFVEKPKTPELIKEFLAPNKKDTCLSLVGPYIFSPEALQRVKEDYINDPESFRADDGMFDFSKKVIGNLLTAMNNGELRDKDGNALKMRAYIKPQNETWSDLGSEKDFTQSMIAIKNGGYSNLLPEIRQTISKNVDENHNITFDVKRKAKLDEYLQKHEITLKNAIIY